eukprot:1323868-Pyramimonas_sp.AAC.1
MVWQSALQDASYIYSVKHHDFEARMQVEVREGRDGRDGAHHRTTPSASGIHGPRGFRRGNLPGNSTAAKPENARKHGSAQESMDHCFPRHQHGFPER